MKLKYSILDPFGKHDITKEILFSGLDIKFIYEAQTRLEYLSKNRRMNTTLCINYDFLFISEDEFMRSLKIDTYMVSEDYFINTRFLLYDFLIENLKKRITKFFLKLKQNLKNNKKKYKKRPKKCIKRVK